MRIRARYILAPCLASALCGVQGALPSAADVLSHVDFMTAQAAFAQDDDPFADEDEGDDPFADDEDDADDEDADVGEDDAADDESPFGDDEDDSSPFDEDSNNTGAPFAPSAIRPAAGEPDPDDPALSPEEQERARERAKYLRPADVPDELKTEADFFATLTPAESAAIFDMPQNDAGYLVAAARVARSGRTEFAKLLLAKAATAQEASPEECAKIVDQAGTERVIYLVGNPVTGTAGEELVASVMARAREWWGNEDSIRAAISDFRSDLPAVRDAASIRVRQGGNESIKVLVADIAGNDASARETAQQLIRLFESEGTSALLGAARTAEGAQLAGIAAALAGTQDVRAPEELAVRYYLAQNDSERNALAGVLTAFCGGTLPTIDSVAINATKRAREYFDRKAIFPGIAEDQVDFWTWDAEKAELDVESISLKDAYLDETAYWAKSASDLRKAAGLPLAGAPELAIVAWSERYADRHPGDDARDGIEEFDEEFDSPDAQLLASALQSALLAQRYRGALIPVAALRDRGDESLCRVPGGRVAPIVQAASCPDRRVRFAALEAIAAWNPAQSYNGASRVVQTLEWFATGSGERIVVIATPHLDEATKIGQNFALQGYKIVQTTTGRDALLAAQKSADVAFVFATAPVSVPDARVIAQMLRADARTGDVPLLVGFSGEREQSLAGGLVGNEPNACIAPTPHNLETASWATQQLFEQTGLTQIADAQRLAQSKTAAQILLNFAVSRPGVYQPENLSGIMSRFLATPALFDEGLLYASTLKTPAAQIALADLVGDPRFDIPTRRRALEAFGRQMARNGSLLRGPDVQKIYDRYNASEKESAESQKVLSDLLDLYENATQK